MNFEDYQKVIETFAVYPRDNELAALSYVALGLRVCLNFQEANCLSINRIIAKWMKALDTSVFYS